MSFKFKNKLAFVIISILVLSSLISAQGSVGETGKGMEEMQKLSSGAKFNQGSSGEITASIEQGSVGKQNKITYFDTGGNQQTLEGISSGNINLKASEKGYAISKANYQVGETGQTHNLNGLNVEVPKKSDVTSFSGKSFDVSMKDGSEVSKKPELANSNQANKPGTKVNYLAYDKTTGQGTNVNFKDGENSFTLQKTANTGPISSEGKDYFHENSVKINNNVINTPKEGVRSNFYADGREHPESNNPYSSLKAPSKLTEGVALSRGTDKEAGPMVKIYDTDFYKSVQQLDSNKNPNNYIQIQAGKSSQVAIQTRTLTFSSDPTQGVGSQIPLISTKGRNFMVVNGPYSYSINVDSDKHFNLYRKYFGGEIPGLKNIPETSLQMINRDGNNKPFFTDPYSHVESSMVINAGKAGVIDTFTRAGVVAPWNEFNQLSNKQMLMTTSSNYNRGAEISDNLARLFKDGSETSPQDFDKIFKGDFKGAMQERYSYAPSEIYGSPAIMDPIPVQRQTSILTDAVKNLDMDTLRRDLYGDLGSPKNQPRFFSDRFSFGNQMAFLNPELGQGIRADSTMSKAEYVYKFREALTIHNVNQFNRYYKDFYYSLSDSKLTEFQKNLQALGRAGDEISKEKTKFLNNYGDLYKKYPFLFPF